MRGRFGLVLRLNHYDVAELTVIVIRSARLLERHGGSRARKKLRAVAAGRRASPTGCCAASAIMRRCARRAYRRKSRRRALDLLEVDRFGLDEIDQKIMRTVLEKYGGGPVGVNTIAASIDEEAGNHRGSLRAVPDPARLPPSFAARPHGTERAFEYFKIPRRMRSGSLQSPSFENRVSFTRFQSR